MARVLRKRLDFGKVPQFLEVPNLIEIQKRSFDKFLQKDLGPAKREETGLQSAFLSVFPITDYNETAEIEFLGYTVGESKYTVRECLQKGTTYAAPIKISVKLNLFEVESDEKRKLKESREQEVYIGEMPMMTDTGTFVINGTERVVVSQLHRSPGVFFSHDKGKTHASGRLLYSARVIPSRGSWLDFEFDTKDILYVRIDRRKKLPATIVLKALGYTNEDLLKTFYPVDTIQIKGGLQFSLVVNDVHVGMKASKNIASPDNKEVIVKEGSKITKVALRKMEVAGIKTIPITREEIVGRIALKDIVDPETGEVVVEGNEILTEDAFKKILSLKIDTLNLLFIDNVHYLPSLRDTLLTDKVNTQEEALIEIYKKLRPGEPPTPKASRELFSGLFFDPKRYDLSPVGRLKLNKRLNLDIPLDAKVLMDKDIIEIVRYILSLRTGKGEVDDIDHLGNRRIRGIGELLENQFRIGLVRMERAIKEKMTLTELETAMPHDLINSKPVMAAVKEFFGSSQLSQFMDQTNPLSEITHKRRLSALGPGGLTRERAGFEVRDVHPTHYGRICPIETPEGPNIGLITSLASYARVNDYGFIEVPYRKVTNGKVTEEVHFFSAIEGEKFIIAEATSPVDKKGNLIGESVSAREGGDFRMVTPHEVQYMDVSPKQVVGISAALIPFLENDDANRALMGSNMQRQAVPLLIPDAPIVGTGMEFVAARDSGALVLARRAGRIESVDASRIVVRASGSEGGVDIYNLVKFQRSNQATCINQRPFVKVGETVRKGDVLADGQSTDLGDLALGQNVLVAFMPWGGYNFEDAILLSERLVRDDVYTSIHIEEFEVEARETKLGSEEITRDIPNVGEEALKDLDESGIIRIGAEVKPGDILVGKVTPKGETQLTPEEKLLRAIFGEKAEEVKESCLYVPPGIEGTVVDVRIFSRKGIAKDERAKFIEEEDIQRLQRDLEEEVVVIKEEKFKKLRELIAGQKASDDVKHSKTKDVLCPAGKTISAKHLESVKDEHLMRIKVENATMQEKIETINSEANQYIKELEARYDEKVDRLRKGDELPPGVNKLIKVYIAMKRKIQIGDKMAGRHGNKGVVAMILPEEDMPYMPDGRPVDVVLNPLGVPSRMNVGQILETHLGMAAKGIGQKIGEMFDKGNQMAAVRKFLKDVLKETLSEEYDEKKIGDYLDSLGEKDVRDVAVNGLPIASPVFEGARETEIKNLFKKAGMSPTGQIRLHDGKTGEPFKRAVTVGYMYMLKLHHLVDDKIHARSIGPYSLVTQQPLGGKAQFGGQRLGEMEVWALEGYGAAYTLQEFLTVKSDDVTGRARMYEAIVKGDAMLEPGVPESFHVLIKELQSLGLDVELLEKKKKGE
ncbi:MAG: DNA-directed RNA polymerase subunit beta [Nitrospiraceae bacterium]|nr:DNA-directed RNA polymerase subunit beta [Nitrospiraceae bacterium]